MCVPTLGKPLAASRGRCPGNNSAYAVRPPEALSGMRIAKPEQARRCSVMLTTSNTSFGIQVRMARAGLAWSQGDLASHSGVSARTIKYVEADRRKPRDELERKSVTPWRMLALSWKAIAQFGFGVMFGQLRRRSSKPRRSVAYEFRVAVRRGRRTGLAHAGSLVAAGFSLSAIERDGEGCGDSGCYDAEHRGLSVGFASRA